MSKDLRARLGATKLLLARLAGSKPCFAEASRIQASAFASMAQSATLQAEERSSLLEMAQEAGFADDDFSRVVESLSSPEPRAKKQRRSMQCYETIVEYFTEQEWAVMKDAASKADEVRHIVLQRATSLGARCPEESTKQLLACLIVTLTNDLTKPISKHCKATEYEIVKTAWKRFIRNLDAPVSYLEKLPASPSAFKSDFPVMFEHAYGESVPVPCQINLTVVRAMQCSFGCRGRADKAPEPSSVPVLQLRGQGGNMDQLNMFARQMLDHADRQERMFSLLLQGGHAPAQRFPRCAGELQGMMVQRQGGSRLLQLGHVQPLIGSSSSSSALQDQPVPPITEEAEHMQDAIVAHAPSASSTVLSARLEGVPSASSAEVPIPSGARSAQNAAQLLDLLEERDVKKKIEAKIAKAAAAAAAKAAPGPPKSDPEPAAKAANAKNKKKCMGQSKTNPPPKPAAKAAKAEEQTNCKEKAKTSPKAPAPKLAAKPKAKANTSLAKAPAPKLAAKPKAKAKTEAPAADQLPELPPGVTFQTELSRSQFLVRIKLDGKQTCKTFKWGDCSRLQFSKQAEARKAAIEFLKALPSSS